MRPRRISVGINLPVAASSAVLVMLTAAGGLVRARAFQLTSGAASAATACRGSSPSWACGRNSGVRARARLTLGVAWSVRTAASNSGSISSKRQGSLRMVEVRYPPVVCQRHCLPMNEVMSVHLLTTRFKPVSYRKARYA